MIDQQGEATSLSVVKFTKQLTQRKKVVDSQPRSQGPLSTSRKYPGCGWSRVCVYKSNPHRGWIIDLILSTLSMEVKVALLLYLKS